MITNKQFLIFIVALIASLSLVLAQQQVGEAEGSFALGSGEGGVIFSCGNGITESHFGEQCDESDLDGASCGSLVSGSSGTLSCSSTCIYDTSQCIVPSSGGSSGGGSGGGGSSGGGSSGGGSSGGSGGSGGGSCIELWTCAEWSQCLNGTQTRFCFDEHECDTFELKPSIVQECVEGEPLNFNSNEAKSDGALSLITGAVIGANGKPKPLAIAIILVVAIAAYFLVSNLKKGNVPIEHVNKTISAAK